MEKRARLGLRGIYEDIIIFIIIIPLLQAGIEEGILSAEAIPVNYYNGRADFVTTIVLLLRILTWNLLMMSTGIFPRISIKIKKLLTDLKKFLHAISLMRVNGLK